MRIFTLSLAVMASSMSYAQSTYDYPADVLNAYSALQLEMIPVTPGFTPPVVSRALGYIGLTAYEAGVHGMPDRTSLAGVVPQLETLPTPVSDLYWPEVINQAVYNVTADMFSNAPVELLDELVDLRVQFTVQHSIDADAILVAASGQYGQDLADAILTYAHADGQEGCQFSNFPADFVPPVGPGLWVPLPGQSALQPYWGDKRCFVVEFVTNDLLSPAPPAFSSEEGSELYNEAFAVYEAVNNATQEEINIAEYWADGAGTVTPPGHSWSMLLQILELENSDLGFAAEAYARMGMALSDAFVQCWATKYVFNLERPITYINSHIDADWTTIVSTPPFPEYTSGHSTQSGAWGVVMTSLFGENYAFTDFTHGDQFGGPRSFTSFAECAEETAISRLYGGIHFPVGNTMGSMSGQVVGALVNQLFEQAVGVTEAFADGARFLIHPNPTQGNIVLTGDLQAGAQFVVYNGAGQAVYTAPAAFGRADVSHLPAGLYIAALENTSGTVTSRTRLVVTR
jgi:hypothetical protein